MERDLDESNMALLLNFSAPNLWPWVDRHFGEDEINKMVWAKAGEELNHLD